MSSANRLLLLEDDDDQRVLLHGLIQDAGYQVTSAARVPDALAALATQTFDLVLSDWKVADGDGLSLLATLRRDHPDTAFILMTAYGNLSHAINTIRAGADDYLIKPFDKSQLLYTLARVSTVQQLQRENRHLREEVSQRDQLVELIGRSEAMQQVFRRVQKIAPTRATVLLYGESGTGKELAARALHQLSERSSAPFVALNCAALPESLFEAELFGAEKGAYTGADRLKIGRIEAAAGGSLFLDEIGELPLSLQAKLLRVLQEGSYQRLGNPQDQKADVRIIAATNRDLQQEVDAGRFRADLFYRLNVVPIRLPALRERREDIPLLAHHFLQQACQRHGLAPLTISHDAMKRLCSQHWSGNVRELAHTLERLALLAERSDIALADLTSEPTTATSRSTAYQLPDDGLNWEAHERDCLLQALQRCQYNRSQAARLLGLPYKAFLYRLEKYNLIPAEEE
ncbi:sigma-54-dependent Fis family transcriptional regulator [Permianibacter sp. IMCC34836]|uniref:sigma-54-dependent transcriptional regulator n=1 Tax=Permianibacter fluminis TaxID=2738515 RepID=UPI0015540985|nr:sigma-54 dependent transcriptional regulator [Permianibacter fluminis]NQD37542.1 sigma-54-dependent Fis family transcriptional regulator [Permianibacter fluminis]